MAEGVVKAMVVLVRVATIAIRENLIMAAALCLNRSTTNALTYLLFDFRQLYDFLQHSSCLTWKICTDAIIHVDDVC